MGIRQSDNTGSLLMLSRCFRLVCQQFVISEWMILTYQCFTILNRGYRALKSSSIFRVLFLNNPNNEYMYILVAFLLLFRYFS